MPADAVAVGAGAEVLDEPAELCEPAEPPQPMTRTVLRLYLSDVAYGGRSHLFAIGIEGRDQADLKTFLPDAERLIAGADAPVGPAPS